MIARALFVQLLQDGERVGLAAVELDGNVVWVLACTSQAQGLSVAELMPDFARLFGAEEVRFITQRMGLIRRAAAHGAQLAGYMLSFKV